MHVAKGSGGTREWIEWGVQVLLSLGAGFLISRYAGTPHMRWILIAIASFFLGVRVGVTRWVSRTFRP